MKEKISSLHDDVMVPKETGHLGEYKNYPERFDPKDKSVITRLEQFGVNIADVEEVFGKKISELTRAEYDSVMAEVVKGEYDTIVASVFDKYTFPSPESPEEDVRKKEMLGLIKRFESMDAKCGVNLIKKSEDFKNDGNMVLSLEAGAHLIKSTDDADKLIEQGIRIFGLQYGKNNTLIQNNSLTILGRDVVRHLLEKNIIVDLAHTGYKARQEVMNMAVEYEKGNLISYTHGSTVEDLIESWKGKVGENRLLTQEEIKRIVKMGGIIGLGVTKPFFGDVKKVAERIDSIAQLDNGIDSLAVGTDFGGVAPEWLNEIKSAKDFHILGEELAGRFNMSDEDIKRVLRTNAKEWIKKAID